MKAIAVVGARLNSSRLPGKHLLDLAGKPMIARIFERLDAVPELSGAVLATTADPYNQPLVDWACAAGRTVLAFDGDVNDLMARVDTAFTCAEADVLIYICGDCPLIEPDFISRALRAMTADPQADFVSIAARGDRRVIHQGIDFFRAGYWRQVLAHSLTPSEREHVGSARHKLATHARPALVDEPELYFQSNHRISVDTPSDYRFMRALYRRWYAANPQSSLVSLAWVIEQLEIDPELVAINAEVHQKTVDEVSASVVLVGACGIRHGLGHLRRLLILAERLADHHAAGVRLLLTGELPALEALSFWPHQHCDRITSGLAVLIEEKTPQAIVFDLPSGQLGDEDRTMLQALQDRGIALFSIDGAIPWPQYYQLDYVPSFHMSASAAHPKRLWGWGRYLLPRFAKASRTRPKLLVLTGGSDVLGLGAVWPGLLASSLPANLEITWVRGPFAAEPRLPWADDPRWQISHNPSDPYSLMAEASMALVVYGVSLFECMAHGLPTVTLFPPKLDPDEAHAFQAFQAAICAEDAQSAVTRVCELLGDEPRASALGERAFGLMAGTGPAELANLVLAKN